MPDMDDQLRTKFNWLAAFKSGLISGVIFLLFPQGSPWAAMSFDSGAVMGRALTPNGTGETMSRIVLHLLLSVFYGVIICAVINRLHSWRAILAGGVVGLALYGINFAIVSSALPRFVGMENRVVFTHIVFGLIAAAWYKGTTKRRRLPTLHS